MLLNSFFKYGKHKHEYEYYAESANVFGVIILH